MLTRMRAARRALAASCAALLLLSATAAHAEYKTNGSEASAPATIDLLVLRPVALISFGISSLLFVFPVLPVMLITRPQELSIPFEMLIGEPAQYVFVDPLGTH